jgi:hypothetical protein
VVISASLKTRNTECAASLSPAPDPHTRPARLPELTGLVWPVRVRGSVPVAGFQIRTVLSPASVSGRAVKVRVGAPAAGGAMDCARAVVAGSAGCTRRVLTMSSAQA